MKISLRNTVSAVSLLILSIVTHAANEDYSYLSEAVNKITEIYYASPIPSPQDRVKIASIACDALERLEKSPTFRNNSTKFLASNLNKNKQAIGLMLGDISRLNTFIETEQKALSGQGFNASSQTSIITTSLARAKGPLYTADINMESIISQISDLKSAACNVKEQALDAYRTSMIKYGLFGASLVAVDGLAEYFSAGTLGEVAAASANLGGVMVIDAVKAFQSIP